MDDTEPSASAQVYSNSDKSILARFSDHSEGDSIGFLDAEGNIGCDLPLTVSIFSDVNARQVQTERLSLRQLQARLASITAPDKAALPLVKLATFGAARSANFPDTGGLS